MPQEHIALTASERQRVLDQLCEKLLAYYVFPDIAAELVQQIQTHDANRKYVSINSTSVLCAVLTDDMQQVSRDQHLCLFYSATELPASIDPSTDSRMFAEYAQRMALYNHGFFKVERLPGNIGYIDLRSFLDPRFASDTAVAVMNAIANTHALIFDLRQNDGGSPDMVALLASYLFDVPVHLTTFYNRPDNTTRQSWTLPYVPGKRYVNKPVYVLTSHDTISGAEEFAYDLQQQQRITIIGEVTAGAAHPGDRYQLTPHIEVFIPTGRAIGPITGTDWDGTGVTPDILVSRQDALDTAYTEALQAVLGTLDSAIERPLKQLADEIRHVLKRRQEHAP